MEETSESCLCSEMLDIILGIVPGELHHMNTVTFNCTTKMITYWATLRGYLQHGRSLTSLRSPASGTSLFISLLISLLISRCCRIRASSLAVRSSQDLEMESRCPGVKPTWFNMPSEQDILFRLMLRAL